jgi:hypothetical protein
MMIWSGIVAVYLTIDPKANQECGIRVSPHTPLYSYVKE